jgi:hypothetical protein
MLRLGILFWYATVGAIIGVFGVFAMKHWSNQAKRGVVMAALRNNIKVLNYFANAIKNLDRI